MLSKKLTKAVITATVYVLSHAIMKYKVINKLQLIGASEDNSIHKYGETPFYVKKQGELIAVTIGNNVIESGFKSIIEAGKYIEKDSWQLRLTAGIITNDMFKKQTKKK